MIATSAPPSISRRAELALLALLLLAALLLRQNRVGWDAISLDEMWHLSLSTGWGSPQVSLPRDVLIEQLPSVTDLQSARPSHTLWTGMDGVVHPPLYVLVLRAWREAFGAGDVAAQWLSVTCSLGSILLLWQAARTAFGPAPGLWAAAMMAFAPTQVFMAQEVRGYALLMLLGCWALWTAARIEAGGFAIRRGVELAAAVLGMMLTHYFAVGACVAIGLWAVLRLRGVDRRRTLAFLLGSGLIYASIWGPFVLSQRQHAIAATELWLTEPSATPAVQALVRTLAMPLRLIAEMPVGWVGMALSTLCGAALLIPLRRQPRLLLFALWTVAVVGLLLALDLARGTRHLSYIRYALLASPALYGWLAGAATALPGRWSTHAACAAVVIAAAALSPTAYVAEAADYRTLRRALADLSLERSPTPAMLIIDGRAPEDLRTQTLFLAASRATGIWPRDLILLSGPLDAQTRLRLAGRRVWLLSAGDVDPQSRVGEGVPLHRQPVIDPSGRPWARIDVLELPK